MKINITNEMIDAVLGARAVDDEGEFPIVLDLLDYGGENKARTVARQIINDLAPLIAEQVMNDVKNKWNDILLIGRAN